MKKYLYEIISNSGNLSTEDIIIRIVVAAALGGAIFLSYWITHSGTIYSRKFNITLLTLTILTATVMTVIGDILVVSTMKRIGFTNSDYAKRHHGGYLGSKSREQSQKE